MFPVRMKSRRNKRSGSIRTWDERKLAGNIMGTTDSLVAEKQVTPCVT